MLVSLNKEVEIDDIIELIAEKLSSGGKVSFTPNGRSMLPMLRSGEDVVWLVKPLGRLKKFDVPFYKRDDGNYVLHRVVGFDPDGCYVMCGDNQFFFEHGVSDSQIVGVMLGFCRKGKTYTTQSTLYRLYVRFWHYTRFFRHCYRAGIGRIYRLFRKGKKTANEKKSD